MTKLLLLILIGGTSFISCDGRDRAYRTNAEILEEQKLLDSFSESIKYIPASYTEYTKDTIFNNGFTIKIKSYSDMDNDILRDFESDSINYKYYYREFKADITVYKDEKMLFSETIDKDFLINTDIPKNRSLNDKILKTFWVEDFNESHKNTAVINLAFCTPNTSKCIVYKLIFYNNKFKIEESSYNI